MKLQLQLIPVLALGAALTYGVTFAPPAHAACDPGYVVGVPISDGRLPVKCVPRNNIPPGYVDATGGNAQPVPGTGHGAGFKTDLTRYPHPPGGPPCNSEDVRVIKVTERGNAIEDWGPPGCDLTKPMYGNN